MKRRVVITGVGPITSIGIGKDEFWTNCLNGVSGAEILQFPWMDKSRFSTHIGAPVKNFDPLEHNIAKKELGIIDLVVKFSLGATYLALNDAGIEYTIQNPKKASSQIQGYEPPRISVIIGTGIGGLHTLVTSHSIWLGFAGKEHMKRYSLPMLIPNALPAHVAIKYSAKGECKAVATACSAGTMAIGDAYRLIRDNEADMAITGGADGFLSDDNGYGLMGFDILNTLSTRNDEPQRASRPFDRDRDGFVLSEGAGILILEELGSALKRGAHIYAEIIGYETNCDAHSILQIDPEAAQIINLLNICLERAGLSKGEVDYINAHGTSTILNDRIETYALKEVFGKKAYDLYVSSIKSMTGHAIGASGAIEAISTALTIDQGAIPPTINLDNPDDGCDLNYVPHKYIRHDVKVALSNSFAFGGHNSCLLMRRYE